MEIIFLKMYLINVILKYIFCKTLKSLDSFFPKFEHNSYQNNLCCRKIEMAIKKNFIYRLFLIYLE